MKRSNENSQSAQLTQQIEVVNTVLETFRFARGNKIFQYQLILVYRFKITQNYRYFIKKKKKKFKTNNFSKMTMDMRKIKF